MLLRINKNGCQLHAHPFHCCILKPILDAQPGQVQNTVFHVGKPEYIARIWNRKFAARAEMISPVSLKARQSFETAQFRAKHPQGG